MNKFKHYGLGLEADDKQQGLDETTPTADPVTPTETATKTEDGVDVAASTDTAIDSPLDSLDTETPVAAVEPEETPEEKETKKIKIEIEIAQEAITTLETIASDLNNTLQYGGLNVNGRSIARTAIDTVIKGIDVTVPTVSNESVGVPMDNYRATTVVVSVIENIIEQLKVKIPQ